MGMQKGWILAADSAAAKELNVFTKQAELSYRYSVSVLSKQISAFMRPPPRSTLSCGKKDAPARWKRKVFGTEAKRSKYMKSTSA
ncbi:MAG: hypothetical protein K9K78_02875 [Spirochaetales bacterium]|nr:hypothetical protein [Spirochaetales bacterium]